MRPLPLHRRASLLSLARSWNTSSYLPTRSALALGNTPKRIAADLEKRRQNCDEGNQEENNLGWGLMQAQYFQHLDDQEQTLQRYSGQACAAPPHHHQPAFHPLLYNACSCPCRSLWAAATVCAAGDNSRVGAVAPIVTSNQSARNLWQ